VSAYDAFGATVSGVAPQWQSLNGAVATVDQNGNVQGLMPGVVTILATDPASGSSSGYTLRVEPLRVDITPARPVLHVGDTLKLAAVALDAGGNPLGGVSFLWNSGIPGIASVASDGTVSALATGAVTISAAINAGSSALDFTASVELVVYRKPDFNLSALVSSDTAMAASPSLAMPRIISASGDNYLGVIGDLSTGGQGVLALANGTLRLLAVTGQLLPGINRVVNRFTGVSVNASGDVVAVAQIAAEWCDSALVFYHQAQPPAVLDRGCNISITDRALADNGDVIYFLENNGNHFYIHHAGGNRTVVIQRGDSLPGSPAVANLGRAGFTSSGAAILEIYPAGKPQQFWRWNGSSFEKLVAANDPSPYGTINNMDFPVESAGALYALIRYSDNKARVMKYASAGNWTLVAQCCTILSGTQVGWFYAMIPAGLDGSLAVVADSYNGNSNSTYVFRLTAAAPDRLANVSSWSNVTQLAAAATGLFDLGSISGAPGVYKLASGAAPTPTIAVGGRLSASVTASLLWDNLPERASTSSPLVRLPGDSIARVSQGAAPLVAPGAAVGGNTIYSLGNVVAGADGKTAILSAQTSGGPSLIQLADGVPSLIADNSAHQINTPFGQLTWFDTNGSPFAMNANKQFVAMANTSTYAALWRFDLSGSQVQVQRIAVMQQPSPAGSNYNWISSAAVDASGNVAFVSGLADGSVGLCLWSNGQAQKLLRTGEPGLNGQPVANLWTIQFAGKKLIARVGYPSSSGSIQAFDGAAWTAVVSQGDTLSFGRTIDNFIGGNVFANDAGDIAYEARVLGFPSLLVRTHDGRDLVAATASDPLPDGSWPLFFYGCNITAQGGVLFVAETSSNGKDRLTLYAATAP
jgi:hypothetical protein